jgi:hypothetical protein
MFRRLVVPLALLSAVGCATGGTAANTQAPADRPLVIEDGNMVKTNEAPASATSFDAPATKVWPALNAAYASLGIDVKVNDASTHRMGNTQFYKSRNLNGTPLSRIADCGNGPNGPRANSGRVYFSVVTTLVAVDAGHTRLTTEVSPVAVDESGTTGYRATCGSTGVLETMLYDAVRKQLGS